MEKKVRLEDVNLLSLFGHNENLLQLIDNRFESFITLRGDNLILKGDPEEIKKIQKVIAEMIYILKRNGELNENDVNTVIELILNGPDDKPVKSAASQDSIIFYGTKEPIRAKTPKQLEYYQKVLANDLLFAIGPAGTGKTYLAVAMAVAALKRNEVTRIILSRPAVEAGESLGFLPGDLKEKLDPYLRPLTDALFYMLSGEKLKNMMEKNIIEIIPLAYMRGRTLNNAFIILDEAQNATITQMKMFLTRLGANSKAIVTGDVTQIDLPDKNNSGLINASRILKNIKDIEFVYFDNEDVVRHKLVAQIIKAYENEDLRKQNLNN